MTENDGHLGCSIRCLDRTAESDSGRQRRPGYSNVSHHERDGHRTANGRLLPDRQLKAALKSPYLEHNDQRLGAEQDQLPVWSTGISLLATVTRRTLAWLGHVTIHDGLSKTIFQGTSEVGQRHSRLRKCWMDNVKEWTSLSMPEFLKIASSKNGWKKISAESSLVSPTTQSVKGLN